MVLARLKRIRLEARPPDTGVLFHADGRGRLRGEWLAAAIESMLRPNADAAKIAMESGATAATDVTGFGLAGHLGEMARASGVAVEVDLDSVPALAGALELFGQGLRSTFHEENESALEGIRWSPGARRPRRRTG